MLKIVDIEKTYKKKEVLKKIDLEVSPSSCIGIAGGNGSGKTTLLSILSGILKPDAGRICYLDREVGFGHKFFSDQVAYVPQENPIIEELSVKDNLSLWYRDFRKLKKTGEVLPYERLGLTEVLNVQAGKLSGGMKKRLSIACALSNCAPLLILDEPGAALDLICKQEIRNYLKEYKKQGGIIILTSHEMEELELCDRLYLLKNGVLEEISTGLSAQQLMNCLKK